MTRPNGGGVGVWKDEHEKNKNASRTILVYIRFLAIVVVVDGPPDRRDAGAPNVLSQMVQQTPLHI
jgi:hypothetical protein